MCFFISSLPLMEERMIEKDPVQKQRDFSTCHLSVPSRVP